MDSTFVPLWLGKIVFVVIGLSVIWITTRLLLSFIRKLKGRYPWFVQYETLTRHIVRIVILAIGVLIILDTLGVSITPLIASLGVGGIAIALALQDTLSNFFSGVYLLVDKPIKVGDFVQLESGEEGYIDQIGWRSTRIRALSNKTVVVPNSHMSSSRIINYDLPDPEVAVLVNVGVHYNSDLEHVERVTIETAREIQENIQGAVKGFKPFIRYNTFADSSIIFTTILRARTFVDNYLIKHEFIKILHRRYKKEGIEIPFPIRTVYVKNKIEDDES